MKYLNPWHETLRALGFLSRISIPDRFFKEQKTDRSPGFYPVAGAIIALTGISVLLIASLIGLPALLSAAVAILTIIAITGGLHEDGLADVADGFGGGATTAQRLAIMKDSRVGTYGVIAIVASLLMRIGALAAVLQTGGIFAACCAMIATATLSRGAMVWFWASLPNARTDGASAAFGRPDDSVVSIAAISGLGSGLVFGLLSSGLIATGIALGFGVLAMYGFQRLCQKMIGGQTGDTIGGCQQLVEIALWLGLATSL